MGQGVHFFKKTWPKIVDFGHIFTLHFEAYSKFAALFMTAIHETAYPRLRSDWTDKQLEKLFKPIEEELKFAIKHKRQPLDLVSLLVQLKVFQCLGRFIGFQQIPKQIIVYMIQSLNVKSKLMAAILRQPKHLKSRYVKHIRAFMDVTPFDSQSKDAWEKIVCKAAQTKHNFPDIINVVLEELVRLRACSKII